MRAVLAPAAAVDRPARLPVEPHAEDRWTFARHADVRPATILTVAAVSFALHGAMMAFLVATGHSPPPSAPHEISVEIVQDTPKPLPAPAKQMATRDVPKPDVPPPAPLAKADAPEPDQPKLDQSKPEPPAPEHDAAKPDTIKPDATKLSAAKPPPSAEAAHELDTLQQELASLKAEHAALQSATAAATGDGSLANSFQAIALPGAGGTGDAVSYQDMVFSQLAKAKGLGRREGHAGTAGVRFEIDAAGALVGVEIATPSGVAALDAEALDIVRRAAPFPPPPKDAEREFFANVTFVPEAAP